MKVKVKVKAPYESPLCVLSLHRADLIATVEHLQTFHNEFSAILNNQNHLKVTSTCTLGSRAMSIIRFS